MGLDLRVRKPLSAQFNANAQRSEAFFKTLGDILLDQPRLAQQLILFELVEHGVDIIRRIAASEQFARQFLPGMLATG